LVNRGIKIIAEAKYGNVPTDKQLRETREIVLEIIKPSREEYLREMRAIYFFASCEDMGERLCHNFVRLTILPTFQEIPEYQNWLWKNWDSLKYVPD
jgi:hypothetical protein